MLKLSHGQKVITNIKNLNSETIEKTKNAAVKFESKIKGTIVETWMKYWKNVYIDYREVVYDVGRDAKEKPTKAMIYISLLGSVIYCMKQNPDSTDFRDTLMNCENKLLLVHTSLQNQKTAEHLKFVEKCYNNHSLRRLNIGIASIMWTDYYSNLCSNYNCTCPYLKLQYKKFKNRIVDIGFLNQWWILSEKMKDYDVNY